MIRTVTLNPGFDEVVVVDQLGSGITASLLERRVQAGGKGFNAARIARQLGAEVTAYGLIGSGQIEAFGSLVRQDGVAPRLWSVNEVTRRNLTVLPTVVPSLAVHFRAQGLSLAHRTAIEELSDQLLADVDEGDVVTLNGSLPSGAAAETWSRIAQGTMRRGAWLIVDVYGPSLRVLLEQGGCHICKPNLAEVRDAFPPDGVPRSVASALVLMQQAGVEFPLITLGDKGVACLSDGYPIRLECAVPQPRIAVGAGDALTGALAYGIGHLAQDYLSALQTAVRVTAAFVSGSSVEHMSEASAGFRPSSAPCDELLEYRGFPNSEQGTGM